MFAKDLNPQQLDLNMRLGLARSLAYVFEESQPFLNIDSSIVNTALEQIRAAKTHPGVFARYYDLVFAINNQDLQQAQKLVDELLDDAIQASVDFHIIPYSEEILGEDYERFPRLAYAGFSAANPMGSPDQALFESHKDKLEQAIEIVREVDSNLVDELESLVSRIIVAVNNSAQMSVRRFGGVTSFMTWGAIFINAESYKTLHQCVDFIVHELTHCVLFGLASEQPLVLNHPSESYPSPLRSDLRPMDGNFHATLVCARLVEFMTKWRMHPSVDDDLSRWLDDKIQGYQQALSKGVEVIRRHGKLSDTGRDLLESAARYA